MSKDHIGVAINGVLYVKFEDAKKLREGWDKADAENEKLRATRKWNIERDGEDLLICEGDHEKHEVCAAHRWVKADTLKAELDQAVGCIEDANAEREQLQAENARLRAALREIRNKARTGRPPFMSSKTDFFQIASKALGEKE